MTTIPSITERHVRDFVGETSMSRGRSYWTSGAVSNQRRQGATLKADVQGSDVEPYRVWVTFARRGIAEASCSCPVGGFGSCKHVAALLMTWVSEPDSFAELEELDSILARRSKDELIVLIKHMLLREPSLEQLLATPLPVAGVVSEPVDKEVYRHQVAAVFKRHDTEWGFAGRIATDIAPMLAIADGFREQGDAGNAVTVYGAVLEELLEQYAHLWHYDEEGGLHAIIARCVDGLTTCLEEVGDDAARRVDIIQLLFAVYLADEQGTGLSDGAYTVLVEQTKPAERHAIAGWLRARMPTGTTWQDDYNRQSYGSFLLDLEADTLDDDAFLRVCRETGRIGDLVERLLELDRVNEALDAARGQGDYALLQLAPIFKRHERDADVEPLIAERTAVSEDIRLHEWLRQRYAARGDTAGALRLAEEVFRRRPTFEGYTQIRDMARRVGRWDALRIALLEQLRAGRQVQLLVKIYLDERDIDDALAVVGWSAEHGWKPHFYTSVLALEVAQVAATERPEAAIEIYRRQAEGLIEQRTRGAYHQASEYLGHVRTLMERRGEAGAWRLYIANLRENHRTLRALKQELDAAGL